MKWKTIIPFAVAIVLAGLAVQLGRGILVRINGGGGRSVKIVLATRELEPGQQIKDGDVTLSTMPSGSTPQCALLALADASNHVAAIPVANGQTLVKSALAPAGSGPRLQ